MSLSDAAPEGDRLRASPQRAPDGSQKYAGGGQLDAAGKREIRLQLVDFIDDGERAVAEAARLAPDVKEEQCSFVGVRKVPGAEASSASCR